MLTYKYSAISKDGSKVHGVVEAYNELDAADKIKQSCDIIEKITQVKTKKSDSILNYEIGGKKLNKKAFTMMCSQFSTILKAGVPISRCTRLVADKTSDKVIKKMLDAVAKDVESGRSVTQSFKDEGGDILPIVFIETINAGELSGNMDSAFDQMYKHYEEELKMAAKVKSALAYPAFVLLVAVVVVIVLMGVVVPKFTEIFDGYGQELPWITRSLIAVANFFQHWYILIVGIIVAIVLAYKLYSNTEDGRMKCARLSFELPAIGNIVQLSTASQFANNMAALMASGLTITQCVNITSRAISNYYASTEVGKMSGKLAEGKSLGDSMRQIKVLPDILVDMAAVGEETGSIEQTLSTIAKYYDSELDQAIADLIKKMEPTLLCFVAVIAGYIVIAIYIAMFSLYSAM
ncbi:MAG: type II secretion system F family protein [Erysipelotrichaceae bacterium]|nr:type II secretion system F family protein [Erysipelotrichaceae bacterium]